MRHVRSLILGYNKLGLNVFTQNLPQFYRFTLLWDILYLCLTEYKKYLSVEEYRGN